MVWASCWVNNAFVWLPTQPYQSSTKSFSSHDFCGILCKEFHTSIYTTSFGFEVVCLPEVYFLYCLFQGLLGGGRKEYGHVLQNTNFLVVLPKVSANQTLLYPFIKMKWKFLKFQQYAPKFRSLSACGILMVKQPDLNYSGLLAEYISQFVQEGANLVKPIPWKTHIR